MQLSWTTGFLPWRPITALVLTYTKTKFAHLDKGCHTLIQEFFIWSRAKHERHEMRIRMEIHSLYMTYNDMMTSLLDQLVAVSVYHLQTWVSNALKCSRILQLNPMELALRSKRTQHSKFHRVTYLDSFVNFHRIRLSGTLIWPPDFSARKWGTYSARRPRADLHHPWPTRNPPNHEDPIKAMKKWRSNIRS